MANEPDELMLDGNSVGGLLETIFGQEMTVVPTECSNCGNEAELGALLAFTQGPGIVLRCKACKEVMLRLVETPKGIIFEARGAAHFKLAPRREI